jgi:hypothetical protein
MLKVFEPHHAREAVHVLAEQNQKAPKGDSLILLPRWNEFRTINWGELFEFPEVSLGLIQGLLVKSH